MGVIDNTRRSRAGRQCFGSAHHVPDPRQHVRGFTREFRSLTPPTGNLQTFVACHNAPTGGGLLSSGLLWALVFSKNYDFAFWIELDCDAVTLMELTFQESRSKFGLNLQANLPF